MNREDAELKIPDWVQGSLAPGEAAAVAAAVAADPALAAYAKDVRLLYALEPDEIPVPSAPEPQVLAQVSASRKLRRVAIVTAAASVLAVLILRFVVFPGAVESSRDRSVAPPPHVAEGPAVDPLPFLEVALADPELPPFPNAGFSSSSAEARQNAALTGRPRLVIYSNPYCPRCKEVLRTLGPAPKGTVFEDVVLERVDIAEEPVPEPLRNHYGWPRIMLHMPIVMMESARGPFGPVADIETGDEVRALAEGWLAELGDEARGLHREAYDEAADSLRRAAASIRGHEFGAAHAVLRRVPPEVRGTILEGHARDLRFALEDAIERELDRIRVLITNNGVDARQGRQLAGRLATALTGHPRAPEAARLATSEQ